MDALARTLEEVENLSPARVARRLSTLSSFYRYCEGEVVVDRNPVAHVRRSNVGTDTVSIGLDNDEFGALIHCAIRLIPDTEYGRIRTRNTDESGHPIRAKADI